MENIGIVIKEIRLKKGISQRELSRLSGVSNAEISRIESCNKKQFSHKIIIDILNVLDPYRVYNSPTNPILFNIYRMNEVMKSIDNLNIEIQYV